MIHSSPAAPACGNQQAADADILIKMGNNKDEQKESMARDGTRKGRMKRMEKGWGIEIAVAVGEPKRREYAKTLSSVVSAKQAERMTSPNLPRCF